MRHPDVVAAAVVGRPDEKYGEEVVAFVQLREGAMAGPADLIKFSRRHLSAVKYPREVRLVDGIPLTSVMKTDRKLLRAMLASDRAEGTAPADAAGPPGQSADGEQPGPLAGDPPAIP